VRDGVRAVLAGAALLAAATAAAVGGCTPSATTSPSGTADAAPEPGSLAPADLVTETWQTDDGPVQMVKSESAHFSVSASCKKPDGSLACEAYRFVMHPVHADLSGGNAHGASQGTLRCVKAKHTLVSAHDAQGNQDGFCKFDDGSYATTGAIESHPMP
jgi:hypothetical protein